MPGLNAYAVEQVPLPINRFPATKTKANVFEILSVDWYLMMGSVGVRTDAGYAFLSTVQLRQEGVTSDLLDAATLVRDPRVFAFAVQKLVFGPGVNDTGGSSTQMPIRIDMTDGNGNGFLVATDNITITFGTESAAILEDATCKILYRISTVSMVEYIGIVQSQQ